MTITEWLHANRDRLAAAGTPTLLIDAFGRQKAAQIWVKPWSAEHMRAVAMLTLFEREVPPSIPVVRAQQVILDTLQRRPITPDRKREPTVTPIERAECGACWSFRHTGLGRECGKCAPR